MTKVYVFANKGRALHMTQKRVIDYSHRALRRRFTIRRHGMLTFCGTRTFRTGQCDVLVSTKRTGRWCGNTYVRALDRDHVRVRIVAGRKGCGEF
jgi:hypothetical protein